MELKSILKDIYISSITHSKNKSKNIFTETSYRLIRSTKTYKSFVIIVSWNVAYTFFKFI